MADNKVLGLIFPNVHDERLPELTASRSLGSVAFGGRYRLIDFPLSNLLHSGVTDIGVITSKNYQTLMEHLGSGKNWDLARKRGGLTILPPYGYAGVGMFHNRIEALYSALDYIEAQQADYIVLTDCSCVASIRFDELIEQHIERGAEITVLCTDTGARPLPSDVLFVEYDEKQKIEVLRTVPVGGGACHVGMGMYIINADLLISMVRDLYSRSRLDFTRDLLQASVEQHKVYAAVHTGYTGIISDLVSYFHTAMELLQSKVRTELFAADRPVYTRILDEAPVIYGLGSSIRNSMVADGCYIDGEVHNSIISRGVHIGKGCKISNCIIMQGTHIGDGSTLSCVIVDKNAQIGENVHLQGSMTYPVCVSKAARV